MASINRLFSIVILSFQFGVSRQYMDDEFSCDNYYTAGTYCTDDYTGYHVCTWNGGVFDYNDTIVTCPPQTRCSCFYRVRCKVETSLICMPYKLPLHPLPIVDRAIFKYSGTYFYEYVGKSPEEFENMYDTFKRSGEIRQDKKKQKYMKIWKTLYSRKSTFHISIGKKGNGMFQQFYGNFDDPSCYKTDRRQLGLGSDLNKYALTKSYIDEEQRTHQEWYYKEGDYEGEFFEKTLNVIVDETHGYVIPTKSTLRYTNPQDREYRPKEVLYYTAEIPGDDTNTDEWFEIPAFC